MGAEVAVRAMGICRLHGKVEGLARLAEPGDLLLGKGEEFVILKSPPYLIVLGNQAVLLGILVVHDLKVPVAAVVVGQPAEIRICAEHHRLLISLLCQKISKGACAGEEIVGRAVGIGLGGGLHRQPGGHIHHGCNRPCGSYGGLRAAKSLIQMGEAVPFRGKLSQLGDEIFIHESAQILGHVAVFHGFQIDMDQIPFLFRELDVHIPGIHIIVIDDGGFAQIGMDHIGEVVGIDAVGHSAEQDDGRSDACKMTPQEQQRSGLGKILLLCKDTAQHHKEKHRDRGCENGQKHGPFKSADEIGIVGTADRGNQIDDKLIDGHIAKFSLAPQGNEKAEISHKGDCRPHESSTTPFPGGTGYHRVIGAVKLMGQHADSQGAEKEFEIRHGIQSDRGEEMGLPQQIPPTADGQQYRPKSVQKRPGQNPAQILAVDGGQKIGQRNEDRRSSADQ